MRKWIAVLLSFLMIFNLFGKTIANAEGDLPDFLVNDNIEFNSLDDPAFLQYMEDSIYANLDAEFADSEALYQIEDVSAKFVSREYLEETAYNSKANIFFGYTLAQIDEVFQGRKYVFTMSNDGDTVVQEFLEIPNDTYNRVIKNVLIGTGVILICVTVSVIAAPAAVAAGGASVASLAAGTITTAAKVHMIFAASAHTAALFATKGALFAGVTTLVTRGAETGWDMDAMTEAALVNSSEAFKWGAITGAVIGGGNKAFEIHRASKRIPSPQESEQAVNAQNGGEEQASKGNPSPQEGEQTALAQYVGEEQVSKGIPTPQEAEQAALAQYGGERQVAFYKGERISGNKAGSVRPDVVVGNEAIEVKCYDLSSGSNLRSLRNCLKTEISQRVVNLPEGMTQRIVLNVEGRGYTKEYVEDVIKWLKDGLEKVYPDIPIDVMGEML